MSHLTEEEQVKEKEKVEADIAVEIPEADFYVPQSRETPTPGVEPPKPPKLKEKDLPLRQPKRLGRARTRTQPHWEKK